MEKKVKVEVPLVPRFIKCGGVYVSVSEFTSEELQQIGEMWTEALVKKARRNR